MAYFENTRLIAKIGTIKKLKIYNDGFTIKGATKSYSHKWDQVEEISYQWNHTTINVFGHSHELMIGIKFKSKTSLKKLVETFRPHSMYVDLSSKSINKVLDGLEFISSSKNINFKKDDLLYYQ